MSEELAVDNKESHFARASRIASLVRDIGMILGIPVVLTVGLKLYDIQTQALEAQVKAGESHIKVVEAQNVLLKETQYDRAVALLKGQKEAFELERNTLEQQIQKHRNAAASAQLQLLTRELEIASEKTNQKIDGLNTAIAALNAAAAIANTAK
jgi:hypothetical protein